MIIKESSNSKRPSVLVKKFGHVYGPIRILKKEHPLYLSTEKFFKYKAFRKLRILFVYRDPRDILVSMYYSFGFSHGLSNNLKLREYQISRREKIQKYSIDEYIIHAAQEVRNKFLHMWRLKQEVDDCIFLRYEDMVLNYEEFYSGLRSFIDFPENVKNDLYNMTRPRDIENIMMHRRSGIVGGYLSKLKPETRELLDIKLHDILVLYDCLGDYYFRMKGDI